MAKPFFQPVLDALAKPHPDPDLKLLLELLKAIEAGDAGRLTLAAAKLRSFDYNQGAIVGLPDAMFIEALSRILVLGRDVEFRLLFNWFATGQTAFRRSGHPVRADTWQAVLDLQPLPRPSLKAVEVGKQFDRVRNALSVVLSSHTISERAPVSVQDGGAGELEAIEAAVVKLVTALMYLFERALADALTAFAKGGKDRGKPLLALHSRWEQIRRATFDKPQRDLSERLRRLSLPLTRMKRDGGKNHYLDAFPPHEARSFEFFVYNREDKNPPKPEPAGVGELLRVRSVQLRYFLETFGEFFPSPAAPVTAGDKKAAEQRKASFAARRALVDRVAKKVKSLDLRTEDAMADFLCAFFTESVAKAGKTPTPEARMNAWVGAMGILGRFARTQTMHSEFNLAEQPSYLGRAFPRALHGMPLFDCGVYAVKATYILLKLAACITRKGKDTPKPEAAFLLLPIHIGLVVKIDEFPWVVVQNDKVEWLWPDEEKNWRGEWDKGADSADPDPASPADKHRKFIEDFAAQHYVSDLDMPIIRIPLDKVSSPPKTTEIWAVFARTNDTRAPIRLFTPEIEKPGAKHYQFDLRFLQVQENERRWHNNWMVPFWNVQCHELWVKSEKKLSAAGGRKRYVDELEAMLKPVSDAYEKDVRTPKYKLSEDLRAATAPIGKQTQRITLAERLMVSVSKHIGPLGQIYEHLLEVGDPSVKTVSPPGFATEDGFLRRIGGW